MGTEKAEKTEKTLLKRFCDNLVDTLTSWADDASRLKAKISAAENIIPIDLYDLLRKINNKLESFRADLKASYFSYQDLEEIHGLKPLSVAYLTKYSILVQEIEDALSQIKKVSEKYDRILEMSKEYKINVDKYINQKNQKAIGRIKELSVEKLLNMLNDMDLLGF